MAHIDSSLCITGVARTIAEVMGIAGPEKAGPSIAPLVQKARAAFRGRDADRVLIYNPDAVALWLYLKYTGFFAEAILHSGVQLPLRSVMPSVTPVCFASMYTGAMPAVHGIEAYEKPVLKVDTLFDALLRAGKRPAIISTAGDSMSRIFLEREMDYFIYDTYTACNEKAMELIEQDANDIIVVYNSNYDATMHRQGPEADASIAALKENIRTYATLWEAVRTHWKDHRTFMGFCPDHGCHAIDGGLGSHGLDMFEDMNVIHFYEFLGG